jgi:hypothetical protein
VSADKPIERRAVQLFLANLGEVSLREWVVATVSVPHGPDFTAARRALETALRRVRDPNVVFETTNAVFDALHRFESAEGRRITRLRRATENLRPATERAALAVLMRGELSAEQFSLLYEPFEPLIPAVLLFGLPGASGQA